MTLLIIFTIVIHTTAVIYGNNALNVINDDISTLMTTYIAIQ